MARHSIAGAALSGMILALIHLAAAQARVTSAAGAKTKGNSVVEAEKSSGRPEGINIHGHWTIEIHNPDGSLVSHTEFENSLSQSGGTLLAQMLGRATIPGNWLVFVTDGGSGGPCSAGTKAWMCVIREANDNVSNNASPSVVSNSLVVSAPQPVTTNGISQLILTGSATAATNSSVGAVATKMFYCYRTDNPPPSTCTFWATSGSSVSGPLQFSQATLPNPIAVTPGQSIQITITFTFS